MRYNLHTHQEPEDGTVALVNRYPEEPAPRGWYSIGIHPWHINLDRVPAQLQMMEQAMADPNCLAVGECGLDKRIETPIGVQEPVFVKQLELAREFRKPVVIHCVAAYQEVIALRKSMALKTPMIIHGFSKSAQVAKQLLDAGFYLSFGKYLLRNPELEPVFCSVPADRFFLETDTIDEPLQSVYDIAAQYRGIGIDALSEQVQKNFKSVFTLI